MTLKRIWTLMRGSRALYVCAICAELAAVTFSLAVPVIVKIIVDSVLGSVPLPAWLDPAAAGNLWLWGGAVLAVTLAQALMIYLRGRWAAVASEDIAGGLKDSLYDHLQKLPYEYHVKAQTGDLIQRCTSDVDTVRRFLAVQVIELARTAFIVALSVAVMLSVSLRLSLLSFLCIPVMLVFSYRFFQKIQRTFLKVDEKEGELSTVLQESVSAVRVVRAFGRQKYETEKFEEKNSEFRGLVQLLLKQLARFWGFSDLVCYSQMGLVLVVGAVMTVAGDITLGDLLLFSTYVGMFTWPIRNIGRLLSDMGKMRVSLERVYEILHTPPEADTPGALPAPLEGDIVFEDVFFAYKAELPILKGLSFTVRPGETIAVLGTTGSGKSTLMHILLRLYDYTGSIRIQGTELRNIEKKWLRQKIGIVLQEPFLYSKTIRRNIRMARHDAADAEIYEAASTAAVHEVVEGFEQGYETVIGERGVTLSGGQRQRVAIARTVIKNSAILIFDDSLSAVDPETDARIREALRRRRKEVTTFIISQRITTLMEADRIFVLEDGRLADVGTHQELIAREGLYARIWNIQNMMEFDFEQEAAQ
jgi:ATP-binding cassette subfamily B protein